MHEKIQRLNKRAKQYGLTIMQVPALYDRPEINSFSQSTQLCKGCLNIIHYLFTYDYLWMYIGFNLIDKYPLNRRYIHNSGLIFIEVDKMNNGSIVWKENTAITANCDSHLKETVFKKTHATFMALDIVLEIISSNPLFGSLEAKSGSYTTSSINSATKKHDCDFDSVSTDCLKGET